MFGVKLCHMLRDILQYARNVVATVNQQVIPSTINNQVGNLYPNNLSVTITSVVLPKPYDNENDEISR